MQRLSVLVLRSAVLFPVVQRGYGPALLRYGQPGVVPVGTPGSPNNLGAPPGLLDAAVLAPAPLPGPSQQDLKIRPVQPGAARCAGRHPRRRRDEPRLASRREHKFTQPRPRPGPSLHAGYRRGRSGRPRLTRPETKTGKPQLSGQRGVVPEDPLRGQQPTLKADHGDGQHLGSAVGRLDPRQQPPQLSVVRKRCHRLVNQPEAVHGARELGPDQVARQMREELRAVEALHGRAPSRSSHTRDVSHRRFGRHVGHRAGDVAADQRGVEMLVPDRLQPSHELRDIDGHVLKRTSQPRAVGAPSPALLVRFLPLRLATYIAASASLISSSSVVPSHSQI